MGVNGLLHALAACCPEIHRHPLCKKSVWTRAGTLAPTASRSPDCTTRSGPTQNRVSLRVRLNASRGKLQKDGGNCVKRSFIVFTFHRTWRVVWLACSGTFQYTWQNAKGEWTDGLQAPGEGVCEYGGNCYGVFIDSLVTVSLLSNGVNLLRNSRSQFL